MDQYLEILQSIAEHVLLCKNLGDEPVTFKSLKEADEFFTKHCFYPNIAKLKASKHHESKCYGRLAEPRFLLKYIQSLPSADENIKFDKDIDFIHLCGGQAITIAENIHTLTEVLKDLQESDVGRIYVTNHAHRNYPTTLKQYNAVKMFLTESPNTVVLPEHYAEDLIAIHRSSNTFTFVPHADGTEELHLLLRRLSVDCPDRALNGLLITTLPRTRILDIEEVFGKTSHTLTPVFIKHPKSAEIKGQYWCEKVEVTILFALLDLSKVIHNQVSRNT